MTKKIHYFSALLLGAFTLGHIGNHWMIVISEQSHLDYMEAFRKIYRFLPMEILLYLSCYVQAISGFVLLSKKWKTIRGTWDKLQVYSGMYLLFFLLLHTSAILFGRYVWQLDTNLYFGAAVVNVHPILYFYLPYYGLGILSIFVHLAAVYRVKMMPYVAKKNATLQSVFIIVIGSFISIAVLYKMTLVTIPASYLENYSIFLK